MRENKNQAVTVQVPETGTAGPEPESAGRSGFHLCDLVHWLLRLPPQCHQPVPALAASRVQYGSQHRVVPGTFGTADNVRPEWMTGGRLS